MSEEIKKLIELQINARMIENRSNYALFNEGMRKGSEIAKEIILSKWQEDERWRKFGTDDLPKIGMRILLRVGERYDTTVICSHSHIHSLSEVFTEWKPIL